MITVIGITITADSSERLRYCRHEDIVALAWALGCRARRSGHACGDGAGLRRKLCGRCGLLGGDDCDRCLLSRPAGDCRFGHSVCLAAWSRQTRLAGK
jgi:hypothetical protein